MEKCKIKLQRKSKYNIPKYQTSGSAGMDLYADISNTLLIRPMERKLIPTGLYIEMPEGYEAQIRARSGISLKYGITLVNGIGTIDSDYRGEVKVILINLGQEDYTIQPGDRVAQMIINKYITAQWELVDELNGTLRGEGGFGHSGI